MLSERDKKALAHWVEPDDLRLLLPYLTGHHGQGECKGFCPNCEKPGKSKSPSAGFNVRTNKWACKGKCGEGGRVSALVAQLAAKDDTNVVDINTGKPVKVDLPSEQKLDEMHDLLMRKPVLLKYLIEERGLSKSTITEWNIGYCVGQPRRNSYVVPVYDENDEEVLQIRLYKRNAQAKMLYWGNGNHAMLMNLSALKNSDEVVLCAGEFDMILNQQNGFPTVTHTGGENTWKPEWSQSFKDKTVFICYDDDDSGHNGALKAAKNLEGIAEAIYIMHLNTGIKGGDITDFYVKLGNDAKDFKLLMDKARKDGKFTTQEEAHDLPIDGLPVSLSESYNPDIEKPLELHIQVAGKVMPNYSAPREIHATCGTNKGPICKVCPMARFGGDRTVVTRPDDPRLLMAIGIRDSISDEASGSRQKLMAQLVEAKCTSHSTFRELRKWSIEQLVAVQALGDSRPDEAQTPVDRSVFSVGSYDTGISNSLKVIGKQVHDPRSGHFVLQSWDLEPLDVDIDKFMMTDETRDELAIFQTDEGQSPLEKCLEITRDLADNVTFIYNRGLVHVAADLVWHSVIGFDLLGRREQKGWLEGLVVGDTRTGKSEIAQRLVHHYRAGRFQSCEGASFAGLVGGAQQVNGKHWSVTWGVIPLNDRRLVVMDEFSGVHDKGVIERMSSIRSEGRAQITMISKAEASARTRMLWLTNPVRGRSLSTMTGVRAIRDLIPQPEDIARFDFAMAVRSDEVASSVINSIHHHRVKHEYTSDLCSKLVMWAWSRKPEQVKWSGKAQTDILKAADVLGHQYVDEPPLLQAANARVKLARLAVAFAVRTFSTTTGEDVKVTSAHVAAAVDFLNKIYSTDAMGYAALSQRRLRDREQAKDNRNEVYQFLTDHEGIYEVLEAVGDQKFKGQDFDGSDDEFTDGGEILKWLRARKMVRRIEGNFYTMEPALIEVMRKLEEG